MTSQEIESIAGKLIDDLPPRMSAEDRRRVLRLVVALADREQLGANARIADELFSSLRAEFPSPGAVKIIGSRAVQMEKRDQNARKREF